MKERGSHGPEGGILRPRQRAEKLVEVTPDYPEKLPKRMASIIKRFEQFEDLTVTVGDSSEANLELNDLMEMAGVLDATLATEIESNAKTLRAYVDAAQRSMSQEQFLRFVKRVDANTSSILQQLVADRRPIALRFCLEINNCALLIALTKDVARIGLAPTVEGNRAALQSPDQQALLGCLVAASRLSVDGAAPSYSHTSNEAFELLRDGDYLATPPDGIRFSIPGVSTGQETLMARIRTFEPQNPLLIAAVELEAPDNGVPFTAFTLSRITGELIPAGIEMVSARSTFEALGHLDVYTRLRDASFAAMLAAVENGIIQERSYISLDADEQQRTRFRPQKVRGKIAAHPAPTDTEPPITPVQPTVAATPESSQPSPQEPVTPHTPSDVRNTVARPTVERAPSIDEQIAAMNVTRGRKENHNEWLESRISWPRVMRAFSRLHVTINLKGEHPKLELNKKTTRYLNRHEKDSGHCKHELFRALKELGISRDDFFAQIK